MDDASFAYKLLTRTGACRIRRDCLRQEKWEECCPPSEAREVRARIEEEEGEVSKTKTWMSHYGYLLLFTQ